jgi:hypothetical protein
MPHPYGIDETAGRLATADHLEDFIGKALTGLPLF